MNLLGKTAVVTGGSRGIGKATVLKLASLGANIAIADIGDPSLAEETKKEVEALGVKAQCYSLNVTDFEACEETVKKIIEDFGGIDILVNNAGITRDALVLSMKEQDFDAVISVNLKGTFNMIKHTYAHFMRKRSGRIINIASVVGLSGNAGQANYSASKAGVVGLTKSVAQELAARGVTCNAVAPGYIITPMTEVLSDKIKDDITNAIPMKKRGQPEDVANAIAFLASEEASYITGEVIRVDGGMAM
ncbi:MAG: 3-oxoacyl-[acyl-carrier-protein] reductase [Bacillota bacterium]|nr:3-oxoacyl-[acyl-carrier-protein] reductase [Bacillota bacterium]